MRTRIGTEGDSSRVRGRGNESCRQVKRAVTLVTLSLPTPARESTAWKRAPSQPLDAITAFAVPSPSASSQEQPVFSGSGAHRVAPVADHPAYFGLAKVNSLTLSAVDMRHTTHCSKSCQCPLMVQFVAFLPFRRQTSLRFPHSRTADTRTQQPATLSLSTDLPTGTLQTAPSFSRHSVENVPRDHSQKNKVALECRDCLGDRDCNHIPDRERGRRCMTNSTP